MKKIPTLFERVFENHKIVGITPNVHPGMEWVLKGEGIATIKWDGSCCAIINGKFYKRYDAKKGKNPPANAIPCCEPDPVTGHWPHWVLVDAENLADKWFIRAFDNWTRTNKAYDWTFEAIGQHFNGNPHHLFGDTLVPHGLHSVDITRTYDGIRKYLNDYRIEGIVFWKDGEPQCKIKRTDFGFEWPAKENDK